MWNEIIAITPEIQQSIFEIKPWIDRLLEWPVTFLFRQKKLPITLQMAFFQELLNMTHNSHSVVVHATHTAIINAYAWPFLHAPESYLTEKNSFSNQDKAGISCHSLASLKEAEAQGYQYAFLSPVKPTATHPDKVALGWEAFQKMVNCVQIPIYALGGLQLQDLAYAKSVGAKGIAGIRLENF